jgi:hypothetical protein
MGLEPATRYTTLVTTAASDELLDVGGFVADADQELEVALAGRSRVVVSPGHPLHRPAQLTGATPYDPPVRAGVATVSRTRPTRAYSVMKAVRRGSERYLDQSP